MRNLLVASCLLALAGCSSLGYDLSAVPFAISAKPAAAGDGAGEPFELHAKSMLWIHGLAGRSQPDVATMLTERCGDCDGVADFRVQVGATFHDWLITHLTLGLVRSKTVTVTGTRLPHRAPAAAQ